MRKMMIPAVSGLLAAAILLPAAAADLTLLPLPSDATFPEGIAFDPATNSFFAGSAVDGVLYRLDAANGTPYQVVSAARIVPQGARFPAMLGMKLDGAGRLWVVGGFTGLITVLDPRDGRLLKQMRVPTTPASLLNDLVMAGDYAYVTDTFTPTLWRVKVDEALTGAIEPWLDLQTSPIQFAEGPNLNGIAATADGKMLITVQMNKGALFRIDTASREVQPIILPGEDLTGADGLILQGRTLYVVRQWVGEIVTVALDENLLSGRVVSRFKDRSFAYPATAVIAGGDMVLANAQFDKHDKGRPETPFSLVRVPLSRLAGQ